MKIYKRQEIRNAPHPEFPQGRRQAQAAERRFSTQNRRANILLFGLTLRRTASGPEATAHIGFHLIFLGAAKGGDPRHRRAVIFRWA
jgi:hypothetical protein